MKKSQLRQIIKEELKSVMNEGFLDTIPYVKDVRAKNRAEKAAKDEKERQYDIEFAESFIGNMKNALKNGIAKILEDDRVSEKEREDRLRKIRFVIFDTFDPNTKGGVEPPSNLVDPNTQGLKELWWATVKPENNFYPPYAMNDISEQVWDAVEGRL